MSNSPSVPQVEPVVMFVVSYYEDTQQNTAPEVYYPLLRTYDAALIFANNTMLTKSGVGVCTIQQIPLTFVYAPHELDVS